MHLAVGFLLVLFGCFLAFAGPGFASAVGSVSGKRFEKSNNVAFRVLGLLLAVMGILYAVGVAGD